jgi:hypothetical protein
MAGTSRPTFAKRQKERARQEKRAEKAQKKAQRSAEKEDTRTSETGGEPRIQYDEEGQPLGLDFNDFQ